MSDLMLDVDQAGEIKAALRRGNWTNAEIKMLCKKHELLTRLRGVLNGTFEVEETGKTLQAAVVDLGATEVRGHRMVSYCAADKGLADIGLRENGHLYFEETRIHLELLMMIKQRDISVQVVVVDGATRRTGRCANGALALLLFCKQHLIPLSWRNRKDGSNNILLFWGTGYSNEDNGKPCSLILGWKRGVWHIGWVFEPRNKKEFIDAYERLNGNTV